jgi:hypothetical protein
MVHGHNYPDRNSDDSEDPFTPYLPQAAMSAAVFVSLRVPVNATLQRGALMSPGPDGEGNLPRSVYSILSVCHFY